jgi:condensin-2 complex subunit D3
VRAHAFLALGKICLRDKALAKENVNIFVRELSTGASPAIKSNALLILGDLCVR